MDKIQDFTYPIDSIRFIKLETNDDFLIGNIQKVILHDGLYYIQDNKSSSIFVVDDTGKFKFKICRTGQGPGEYGQISKLLMDYNRKQLLVYDVSQRKMIYYTLDGKHIKDIHRFCDGAVIRDIALLSSGSFLCYTPDYMDGHEYWGVWKVDSTGKFDKFMWKQTDRYQYVYRSNSFFYELGDGKVGLWCSDYDDVIHFSNDSMYKYLSVKLNRKTVTDYPIQHETGDGISFKGKMWKLDVVEKDNFVYITWWDCDQFYRSSLYLKNEKKAVVAESIKFGINNEDNAYSGPSIPFNRTDQIMRVISVDHREDLFRSKYVSDKNKSILKTMLANDDDNPVLQILYLKKH